MQEQDKIQINTQPTIGADRGTTESRPNENGSLYLTGFVKIHDPNSNVTFLETRE